MQYSKHHLRWFNSTLKKQYLLQCKHASGYVKIVQNLNANTRKIHFQVALISMKRWI